MCRESTVEPFDTLARPVMPFGAERRWSVVGWTAAKPTPQQQSSCLRYLPCRSADCAPRTRHTGRSTGHRLTRSTRRCELVLDPMEPDPASSVPDRTAQSSVNSRTQSSPLQRGVAREDAVVQGATVDCSQERRPVFSGKDAGSRAVALAPRASCCISRAIVSALSLKGPSLLAPIGLSSSTRWSTRTEVGLGDGAPPARPASGRNPACLSKRMRLHLRG
jgi:hypothetical protein